MSNKLYIPSKDKPNSLWVVNKYINCDSTRIASDILNNQIDENNDKSKDQQTRWSPSKLDGYISDEFRNIEFAD